MDGERLARAIREKALALGFDRVGYCDTTLPPESSLFVSWVRRGLHADMGWIEKGFDRRLDPGKLLPGARSFVMVARAYASPGLAGDPSHGPPADRPFVARYARGRDYHETMGESLTALEDFIETEAPGHRALAYVDTGAILERLWAARAGIGWVGRNALVLNEEMGSFFLIGLVLTTLPLPPDRPVIDRCGHCTLCLDACPTGAILPDRVVDSRRCLSYQTIEKRGAVDADMKEAVGPRLFGCDDCQEVCPWNRRQAGQPGPGTLPDRPLPSLIELLSLSAEAYQETFRGSAMKRATFTGIRRNAALALGHVARTLDGTDRAAAVEALKTAAGNDSDKVIRDQAEWSLRQLTGDQAQPHPPGRPQPPPEDGLSPLPPDREDRDEPGDAPCAAKREN